MNFSDETTVKEHFLNLTVEEFWHKMGNTNKI